MIKNDRQYQMTRAEVRRFRDALRKLEDTDRIDAPLQRLEIDALQSQLASLDREVAEYEALRDRAPSVIEVESFEELPLGLIKARIAAGLTQRQLADLLGMKQQQVQRYESSEYAGASLSRVQEVARALGVRVRNEIFLSEENDSVRKLTNRLRRAGVDRSLIERRLMAPDLRGAAAFADLAAMVSRVFRLSQSALLTEDEPLYVSLEPVLSPSFKLPARANEPRVVSYTLFARYIARLAIDATPSLEPRSIPDQWRLFHDEVINEYGSVKFETVLEYVWSRGIVVLPLADSGSFHAAFWRLGGRDVIVLKQRTRSAARWLFDLLHDCYHCARTSVRDYAVVEDPDEDELDPADDEEVEANLFAGNVIFSGRADSFAQEAVAAAQGRLERLKRATSRVADRHEIDEGALASYLAWRLALQGEDWWGAANNLQDFRLDPWELARDEFLRRADMMRLQGSDRDLLIRTMQEDG